LIGIYLYTFENGPLDIIILVKNIKSTILKKQKEIGKAERTEKPSKSGIFLLPRSIRRGRKRQYK
jgi:hypothetical protein